MVDSTETPRPEQIAGQGDHVAPAFRLEAFHCPYCGVLARQEWTATEYKGRTINTRAWISVCFNCKREAYWLEKGKSSAWMVEPESGNAALPHPDMPADVAQDYLEARSIVGRSPRGACALLRLAVQKLCVSLGEKGDNLNDDIASLVKKGLEPEVQQALDALRVIGNNAVHPGEIDLRDDQETASALFNVMNFIVEQRITRPKKLRVLYDNLPDGVLAQIEKRDSTG